MSIATSLMSLGKAQDADNARTYLVTTLAAALDTLDAHDHAAGKGNPIMRIQSSVFASRPAAGHAGHVHVSTNDNRLSADNGTSWIEALIEGQTRAATFGGGLTVSAGGLLVTAGNVGIGGASQPNRGLWITDGTITPAGGLGFGLHIDSTITGNANAQTLAGVAVAPTIDVDTRTSDVAAGLYLAPTFSGSVGAQVASVYVGPNSSAQASFNKFGVYIGSQTGANTTNYGLYIDAPSGASVVNRAIHAQGGGVAFFGRTGMGAGEASNTAVNIQGFTSNSSEDALLVSNSAATALFEVRNDGRVNVLNGIAALAAGASVSGVSGSNTLLVTGDGTTSAHNAMLVQNSVGTNLLTLRNDGLLVVGSSASVLAFFGGAGAGKATVTGSRGGNAALASLLTTLASYGLITDSTSA